MCFLISNLTPWDTTTIYKVVSANRGSPLHAWNYETHVPEPAPFIDGAVVKAKANKQIIDGERYADHYIREVGKHSEAGLYVFRTKKGAESMAVNRPGRVILACHVRRSDFIASGVSGRVHVATYKRLKVIGEAK